ncbi:hypothetical protein I6A81_40875 [Frankia sp. CN7]|nr:hypothetical protein [Frankia nepalensis]
MSDDEVGIGWFRGSEPRLPGFGVSLTVIALDESQLAGTSLMHACPASRRVLGGATVDVLTTRSGRVPEYR